MFLSGLRLRAPGLRATDILGSITTHTFQVPLLWALEWCCFTEAAPPVMRISDQSSRKFCCWSDTKSTFRFWKGFSRGCLWRSRRNSMINNTQQQPFCRETRVHVNAFKSPAEGVTPFPLSLPGGHRNRALPPVIYLPDGQTRNLNIALHPLSPSKSLFAHHPLSMLLWKHHLTPLSSRLHCRHLVCLQTLHIAA